MNENNARNFHNETTTQFNELVYRRQIGGIIVVINKIQMNELEKLVANIQLDMLISIKQGRCSLFDESFYIVELLAVLYGKQMKIDTAHPESEDCDRLVLTRKYAGLGLYSVLANVGYFDKEKLLSIYEEENGLLSQTKQSTISDTDVTAGSQANGVAIAAGIATGLKLASKGNDVYLIIGEDEWKEKDCWEVFRYIVQVELFHCKVIIVAEDKPMADSKKKKMKFVDLYRKMEALSFFLYDVDGVNIQMIDQGIEELKKRKKQAGCMILHRKTDKSFFTFIQNIRTHLLEDQSAEITQMIEQKILDLQERLERMS